MNPVAGGFRCAKCGHDTTARKAGREAESTNRAIAPPSQSVPRKNRRYRKKLRGEDE